MRAAVAADAARDPGAGRLHVGAEITRPWPPAAACPRYLYPEDAAKALARVMRHVAGGAAVRPRSRRHSTTPRGMRRGAVSRRRSSPATDGSTASAIEQAARLLRDSDPGARVAADPAGAGRRRRSSAARSHSRRRGRGSSTRPISARCIGLAGRERRRAARRRIDESAGASRCEPATRSLSRRWPRAGWSCSSASSTTPCSVRSSPAEPAASRRSCSKDVAVRICPLHAEDASEMIRSLATVPAADRLPRGGAGRHRRRSRSGAARRRDGRGPSRDRRARPQSGCGGSGWGARRGCADPGSASAAGRGRGRARGSWGIPSVDSPLGVDPRSPMR